MTPGVEHAPRLIREASKNSPGCWSTKAKLLADANVLGGSAPRIRRYTSSVSHLIRAASENTPGFERVDTR